MGRCPVRSSRFAVSRLLHRCLAAAPKLRHARQAGRACVVRCVRKMSQPLASMRLCRCAFRRVGRMGRSSVLRCSDKNKPHFLWCTGLIASAEAYSGSSATSWWPCGFVRRGRSWWVQDGVFEFLVGIAHRVSSRLNGLVGGCAIGKL